MRCKPLLYSGVFVFSGTVFSSEPAPMDATHGDQAVSVDVTQDDQHGVVDELKIAPVLGGTIDSSAMSIPLVHHLELPTSAETSMVQQPESIEHAQPAIESSAQESADKMVKESGENKDLLVIQGLDHDEAAESSFKQALSGSFTPPDTHAVTPVVANVTHDEGDGGMNQADEPIGIDTVDVKEAQGNWLFKRIWWERAEAKYEKIRSRVSAIFEARMLFFSKRSEFDKNIIDPFFISIGITSGQLQELIHDLIVRLNKERELAGSLNQQERALLENLEDDLNRLQDMKSDIEKVGMLSRELDHSLDMLMEQINRIKGYEQDAWQLFKEVARVLNDKKAREIFYKMDAVAKNISDVATYIQQQFEPHFNNVVAAGQRQVERLNTVAKDFHKKGVVFKDRFEQLEALKSGRCNLPKEEKKPERDEQELAEQEEDSVGFFSRYIVNPLVLVSNSVGSFFQSIVTWITSFWGSSESSEESEE